MNPTLPWVFVQEDGVWVLAACGSTTVAAEDALVLLPPRATFSGELAEEQPNALRIADQRRAATWICAPAVVGHDGCSFPIGMGEVGAEQPDLIWEGPRLWLTSKPELVFLGMPRLARSLPPPKQPTEGVTRRDLASRMRSGYFGLVLVRFA